MAPSPWRHVDRYRTVRCLVCRFGVVGLAPLAAGTAEYHAGFFLLLTLTFERSALGAVSGKEKPRLVAVRLSPYRSIDRVD